MDYLLPSDETMKRMASEYSKIKRVCIPPRANAFAVDEESECDKSKKLIESSQQETDSCDFDILRKRRGERLVAFSDLSQEHTEKTLLNSNCNPSQRGYQNMRSAPYHNQNQKYVRNVNGCPYCNQNQRNLQNQNNWQNNNLNPRSTQNRRAFAYLDVDENKLDNSIKKSEEQAKQGEIVEQSADQAKQGEIVGQSDNWEKGLDFLADALSAVKSVAMLIAFLQMFTKYENN